MKPRRDLNAELFARLRATPTVVQDLVDLVAAHSIWVPSSIVRAVDGAIYPKTQRVRGRDQKRGDFLPSGVRLWENQPARRAFWTARGESQPKNSQVCHIYGDQDSVHYPEHFTHLGNLTALPQCLESLTDAEPIRAVVKFRSYSAYGYTGPQGRVPEKPGGYPESWPGLDETSPEDRSRVVIEKLRDLQMNHPTFDHWKVAGRTVSQSLS